MKKPAAVILSTLAALGLPNAAVAGQAVSCETDKIQIDIIQDPLQFGTITPCLNRDGRIIIRPNGSVRVRGCIDGTAGIIHIARVRVAAGQDANRDRVTVQLTDDQLTISSNGQSMLIDNLRMRPGTPNRRIVRGRQTQTFDISARLNVEASQVSGTYTGSFTVNAECVE